MGNAMETARSATPFVTLGNDEDGLAVVLDRLNVSQN